VTACRVTAAGGVVGVFVLGGVAASSGSFCAGCFATYVLVAGYAGIALFGWQHLGVPDLPRGAAQAFGTLAATYLLLLYPGRATPKSAADVGRQAVAQSAPAATSTATTTAPAVAAFLATLAPGLQQTLADALLQHRGGIALPLPRPRAVIGDAAAPVRITEFTDVLCDHCAQLHETIGEIERRASGTFQLEPRQFPLDASCNPAVQRSGTPLRCLAAKAEICLEGIEGAFEYSGALFAKQKTLTESDVFALAEPHMKRAPLEACVASAETKKKLADDIALALRFEPDGTPLVLVNGRKASAFAPFLYALVLSGGRADDPAFAALPPGNPNAHVH
jgi:serine/threonine-protein kinase